MKKVQKYKPILFSTIMVEANAEDRKTQTRRIVDNIHWVFLEWAFKEKKNLADWISRNAKIKMEDILWVRETWFSTRFDCKDLLAIGVINHLRFKADNNFDPRKDAVGRSWKPSIHMPKDAARMFLKVLNVRIERLQDIENDKALAEGIKITYAKNEDSGEEFRYCFDYLEDKFKFISPVESFKTLWAKINGKDSWNENPFVWVYEYEIIQKPEGWPL